MNRELIKKRFTKNLRTYNDCAKVQKQMAKKLLTFAQKDYENILEIGCGTGLLTRLAVKKLNYKTYTANDIVDDCSFYIKQISPDIDFIADDIENFLKTTTNKYDLIISNAAFQWIENIDEFIIKLKTHLKPNGHLLFSTFGIKNFKEICQISGKTLPYKTVNDYRKMFKDFTYNIEEEIITLSFDSPIDVLRHIKNTGVNALSEIYWTKSDMIKFEKEYNALCLNKPILTYNPVYISINSQSGNFPEI